MENYATKINITKTFTELDKFELYFKVRAKKFLRGLKRGFLKCEGFSF